MNQIDEWLNKEDVSFEEDDNMVRYLVSSIRVTEDFKLTINLKGGGTITEPVCCEKVEKIGQKTSKLLDFQKIGRAHV